MCLLIPISYHDLSNKSVLSLRFLYKHPANNLQQKPSHCFLTNFTRDKALNITLERQETSFAWFKSDAWDWSFSRSETKSAPKHLGICIFWLQPTLHVVKWRIMFQPHENHIHLPHLDHLGNSSLFGVTATQCLEPPRIFCKCRGQQKWLTHGWRKLLLLPKAWQNFTDSESSFFENYSLHQWIRFNRFAFTSSFIPFKFNDFRLF